MCNDCDDILVDKTRVESQNWLSTIVVEVIEVEHPDLEEPPESGSFACSCTLSVPI